jgi:polyhydroxyalkanoate synthesis regulator phasin
MQPFQAAQQAWLDFASRLSSGSMQSYMTGFERTFGGLFDALGFGPMRKLQAGLQELAAASVTQNQSRAAYGMLVQNAFASGAERLMKQLAGMADAGERVESVLTLLRMWAVNTEQAVHEMLQSERGLEATAAMTRASLTHRRKLQQVAAIVADSLDIATRRELDEVYREIHELKREVRALRASTAPPPPAHARSTRRKIKS